MAIASRCKVSGSGIETAVVRQLAAHHRTISHEGYRSGEIFVVVIVAAASRVQSGR